MHEFQDTISDTNKSVELVEVSQSVQNYSPQPKKRYSTDNILPILQKQNSRSAAKKVTFINGFRDVWRSGSLRILLLISKFIVALRRSPDFNKLEKMTPHIYQIINDKSADYEFYKMKGYFTYRKGLKGVQQLQELLQQVNSLSDSIGVFKPEGLFLIFWNSLLFVMTSLCLCYIPLKLAYPMRYYGDAVLGFYDIIFLFIPWIILIADIVVNFHTAYYFKGQLHTQRKDIRAHYIHGEFFKDVSAVLIIFFSGFFHQLLIVAWFLKVESTSYVIKKIEQTTTIRLRHLFMWDLLKLILFLIFMCHNFACAWRYVVVLEDASGETYTWLDKVGLRNSAWNVQYTCAMYWAMITLTTIGYGDIYAQNQYEMLFIIFVVPISLVLFGYAISSIQSIFAQVRENQDRYNIQMGIINGYIKKNNLDHQLSMRVRNYFDCYLNNINSRSEEANILVEKLNQDLKMEVKEQVFKKILMNCWMLKKNFDDEFIRLLCQEVKTQKYIPGDIIFQKGQSCENLYFLVSGELQLFIPKDRGIQFKQKDSTHNFSSDRLLIKLTDGDVAGEYNFCLQKPFEFSARAQEFSEVALLPYKDFVRILKKVSGQYERFALLKENLDFNPRFKGINKVCEICHFNHFFQECPFVFIQSNRRNILENHRKSQYQTRQKNYARTQEKAIDFRSNRKNIQLSAIAVAVDLEYFEEYDLSRQKMSQFGLYAQRKKQSTFGLENIDEINSNSSSDEKSQNSVTSQESPSNRLSKTSHGRSSKLSERSKKSSYSMVPTRNKSILIKKNDGFQLPQEAKRQSVLRFTEPTFGQKAEIIQRTRKQSQMPNRQSGDTNLMFNNQEEENALDIIKEEYLNIIKGEDIEGFESRHEYKHFYPSKNLSRMLTKNQKSGVLSKGKRTFFEKMITKSQK